MQEMLKERDEGARRALGQQEELAQQRDNLQNQQRDLFMRQEELGT